MAENHDLTLHIVLVEGTSVCAIRTDGDLGGVLCHVRDSSHCHVVKGHHRE